MKYVTFSNKLGQVHKMWAEKEGNSFVCYKIDDINAKREDEEEFETNYGKSYKMWVDKKYNSFDDANTAILRYVDAGIRAKIFVDKNIVV